jgi:hypothetical protein
MIATRRQQKIVPGPVAAHTCQHDRRRRPPDQVEARQHVGLLVLLLAVAAVALHQAGRGALAGPQLDAPGTWSAWLSARTGTEAAFAVLRLVALATTAYLGGATGLGLVARLAGRARWIRWADALAVPAVRRVLQHAFGAGLAAAVALGPVAATTAARPVGAGAPLVAVGGELAAGVVARTPVVVDDLPLVLLDPVPGPDDDVPTPTTSAATTAPTTQPPPTPTTTQVPPTPTTTSPASTGATGATDAVSSATAPPPVGDGSAVPGVGADTWEVGAGDHFWGIAETVLARTWGRPPTDAETARYWRALIDRNAGRLAVPGNPDIVLVGQVLELAPVPAVAA